MQIGAGAIELPLEVIEIPIERAIEVKSDLKIEAL